MTDDREAKIDRLQNRESAWQRRRRREREGERERVK